MIRGCTPENAQKTSAAEPDAQGRKRRGSHRATNEETFFAEKFAFNEKTSIFAHRNRWGNRFRTTSGCGAVRLAHLLWEQGVPSSNLGTPT